MTIDSTRRADAIALAALAGIITLLFLDVLAGVNVFYARDVAHYYYPAKHVLREIVQGGEFPYWNPYFAAGQPLAANPEHEVFYPLTWVILLGKFRTAFHLQILLHLYIGAGAMFALLRSLRIRPAGAFFGALAFAVGGIGVSYLNLLPILYSVVWMPLTCLFTRRFLLDRRWRDFGAASLFFGLQCLVAEPSTIIQTGLLLGFYALHRCVRDRSARPLVAVAAISLAALGVGAVQILPTLDHATATVRGAGLDFDSASQWSMPLARLGEFFHPNLFGHLDLEGRSSYWGGSLYVERDAPYLFSIYPGLLLSVVVLGGFLARVRGWQLTLIVVGVSTLFALGGHTPLWELLHRARLVSWLRFPEKFLLMALFALLIFGARSLDELLNGNERVRRRSFLAAVIVAALAVSAAVLARTPFYAPLFVELWQPRAMEIPLMVVASATGWLLLAGRAAITALLVRKPARTRTWLAVATTFVVIDLGVILFEAVPRMPVRFYDEPPRALRQLPLDRTDWRLFHHAILHKKRPEVAPYMQPHPDRFWVLRNAMMPAMPAQYGIRLALEPDYDLTALRPTADFVEAMAALSDLRRDWIDIVASMSNLQYRAVYRIPQEAFAEAGGDRRVLSPILILPLPRYPRYYFANAVEHVDGRADFVARVSRASYRKQTALTDGPSFAPAAGRVLGVQESANGARLDVETDGRAFLVISVTPHKYWTLTVDGRKAEAVVTNIGYQGVVVPAAGRHVVEMRYRNPLVAVGGALSLLSLLALAFITMRRL